MRGGGGSVKKGARLHALFKSDTNARPLSGLQHVWGVPQVPRNKHEKVKFQLIKTRAKSGEGARGGVATTQAVVVFNFAWRLEAIRSKIKRQVQFALPAAVVARVGIVCGSCSCCCGTRAAQVKSVQPKNGSRARELRHMLPHDKCGTWQHYEWT